MLSLSFSPPAMAMILALCPPTARYGQGTFSHLPCRTHKPLPLRCSTFGSPLHLCAAPGIAFRAFFPIAQHRRLAVASSDDAEIAKEDALPDPEALPYEVYQTLHVECWGTVYTGPNEKKYWNWNNMYPYPVGYVSMKSYKRRNYRQTITEGSDGPLFVLEEIGKGSFTSDSPAKVWKLAIPTENGLVNGARHFGFRSPEVISILQAMAAKVKKSGGEEVSNEEKAEHKGTEESILNDQFVLDASTSEEDHEFAEDETLEEEQNNLSFDVYSTETPSAEDESVGFDETGTLLNNFKLPIDSKNSTIRDELDNFELSSSQQFTLDSENDTPDIDSANNGVYHPSFSRPKTVEIWKRGQGIGSGKPQFLDRPGVDQWSSSGYGLNGSKSWETSSLKKKEDNLKSTNLLLGLLHKWNKIKKWNYDPGDRMKWRGDSKHPRLQEPKDASYTLGRKPAPQTFVPENNLSALKGDSSRMRKLQSQETMQGSNVSSLENGKPAQEELRISNFVDESTNYAINRLFESVGNKNNMLSGENSQARPLKDKSLNHVANRSTRSTEALDTKMSLQTTDHSPDLVREDPKASNFAEMGVNDRISETVNTNNICEPLSWVEKLELQSREEGTSSSDYRLAKTAERSSGIVHLQHEEKQLISNVRNLVLTKRFEDALSAVRNMRLSGMPVDEKVYEAILCFKLDPWQKEVFKQLQDGNSLLVTAPGGTGKSTAATCCLYRNMVENHRALFVTPNEHLAKQEFLKFGSLFGNNNVGGMWTKMRMQGDPKLVVITLETLAKVLRELNGSGGSEFCFFFEGINLVVLDKFHTFGDPEYSSLWEEVLMLMDAKIRIVALSLPISNEDQVASWIDLNRGPCKLVSCKSEHVPKRYFFCHNSGLLPLFDPKGPQLNQVFSQANGGYDSSMTTEQLESFFWSGYDRYSLQHVLSVLKNNLMLPALVMFFDVKGCHDALRDAFTVLGEGLLSMEEIACVESQLAQLGESHPDLFKVIEDEDQEGLRKGFATFHEGKLPFWQNFVLKLFQENLLKLLIVTERVFLKTEMAVRTIILPSACKVLRDGVSPIPPEQVLQLTGSAGRRCYDIEGNVVFLKSFYSGPKEAMSLLVDNAFKVSPSFKPSYSLIANLVAKHRLPEVKKVLGRSFSDYVFYNTYAKEKILEELDQKVLGCLELKADLEVRLFQGLTEVNKRKLLDAAMFTRVEIGMSIHAASQTHSGKILPGILIAVVPGPAESLYMVLGLDNNFRMLPAGAFDHVYMNEVPPLDVVYKQATGLTMQPPLIPPQECWTMQDKGNGGYIASGNSQTKEFVRLLMEYPVQLDSVKEGLHLRQEIEALEAEISVLIGRRKDLLQKQNGDLKLRVVQEKEDSILSTTQLSESETWKEALRLLKVLERADALSIPESQKSNVQLKPLGMLISRLHNVENELWVAMVVTSKYVKPLLPAEFASLVATIVPERPELESRPSDQRDLSYKVTKPVKHAFTELEVLRKHIAALQGSYCPPIHFDATLSGTAYAWARGRPGTGSFNITSTNDGDVVLKLRKVANFAYVIYQACSQVTVDLSNPNEFNSLSSLARRAEQLLSRYLMVVDSSK